MAPSQDPATVNKTMKGIPRDALHRFICLKKLCENAVCVETCIDCNCCKAENDDSNYNIADVHESLLPNLVAHSDALECAPETMAEVETESSEPNEVNYNPNPVSECRVEENVWILSMVSLELSELHVSPEVVEVECYNTKNDNSENEHVLGSPRLSLTLAT